MAVGILLVLIVGIAFVGIMLFTGGDQEDPAPPPATASAEPESKPKPTSIADIPKESIDKAKAAVAQVNEKSNTDEILGDSKPADSTAVVAPQPAPTPTAKPAVVEGPRAVTYGQQDPNILDWVENLRGIQVGRGKMILDGTTYPAGTIVNPELGIRWIGEDKALGLLYFEDANGVRYEKEF